MFSITTITFLSFILYINPLNRADLFILFLFLYIPTLSPYFKLLIPSIFISFLSNIIIYLLNSPNFDFLYFNSHNANPFYSNSFVL